MDNKIYTIRWRRRTVPSVTRAMAEMAAGMATSAYTIVAGHPKPSRTPPSSDPTIDPPRPTPFAQATPVARYAVG